jgi:Antitoxin FitA-like, ribbon-helix-helix
MPSITIKKFPLQLLARLRETAAASRRSVTQEVLARLEASLADGYPPPSPSASHAEADRQAKEWSELAGKWKSNLSVQEEVAALYRRRSRGRKVEL